MGTLPRLCCSLGAMDAMPDSITRIAFSRVAAASGVYDDSELRIEPLPSLSLVVVEERSTWTAVGPSAIDGDSDMALSGSSNSEPESSSAVCIHAPVADGAVPVRRMNDSAAGPKSLVISSSAALSQRCHPVP